MLSPGLSLPLLLSDGNFNWCNNKTTQIARVLSVMDFLSVQLKWWYQRYDFVSGLKYFIRHSQVYQNLLIITIQEIVKCCVNQCPVKWKIYTVDKEWNETQGKSYNFPKLLLEWFSASQHLLPQAFCRLFLVFPGNCEGERCYIKHVLLLRTVLGSSRKGGEFSGLVAVIVRQLHG